VEIRRTSEDWRRGATNTEGVDPAALALRRLLILVLTAALAMVVVAMLWHFAAGLFSGGLQCVNPDVNCGPG
jgi:hypothetical protein